MPPILKDYQPPGTAPGTLPVRRELATRLWLLRLDQQPLVAREVPDLDEVQALRKQGVPLWLHVAGFGNGPEISALSSLFPLHPLALEDALQRGQRPKAEEYEGHAFVILQYPGEGPVLRLTQVSLFLGSDFLVTLQPGVDVLAGVRERLAQGAPPPGAPSTYTAYAVMDFVVDSAFPVLEGAGARLEALEELVVAQPGARENVSALHRVRRELLRLRHVLWPQRDVMAHVLREWEHRVSLPERRVYLRDLYDHAVQALDTVEGYREIVTGLFDLYLTGLSLRLNDIMRVLTVIATIFMPLSFLASVYGMNFDRSSPWNLPELGWRYGYLTLWGIMLIIAGGMLVYFRRKRWL